MKFELKNAVWINAPGSFSVGEDSLEFDTEPNTDFWQRTYYGFCNDNSPALLNEADFNFSFSVKCSFGYKKMFDQCGILVYSDSENWMKAGLEYENERISRLGSVVTNSGYSDWATTDIENLGCVYYRLHRRGPDFMIESSYDGLFYTQMRIFHMHAFGETTVEMGKEEPMIGDVAPLRFGLYASSPAESSFKAKFTQIDLRECGWKAHS
ncbi:MAG: DUF1349 domain-containing protein [Spirochaetales bacterium]|nr:DUF1349 domain-containing protein [Spirochaetales bacterium]